MQIRKYIDSLQAAPENIQFNDVIGFVDAHYDFIPTTFKNGNAINEAGKNSGSCKLFSFAKLNDFSESLTLHCFGDYYRKDVLQNPDGTDHQNIRNFIATGWKGIFFEGTPLKLKTV